MRWWIGNGIFFSFLPTWKGENVQDRGQILRKDRMRWCNDGGGDGDSKPARLLPLHYLEFCLYLQNYKLFCIIVMVDLCPLCFFILTYWTETDSIYLFPLSARMEIMMTRCVHCNCTRGRSHCIASSLLLLQSSSHRHHYHHQTTCEMRWCEKWRGKKK